MNYSSALVCQTDLLLYWLNVFLLLYVYFPRVHAYFPRVEKYFWYREIHIISNFFVDFPERCSRKTVSALVLILYEKIYSCQPDVVLAGGLSVPLCIFVENFESTEMRVSDDCGFLTVVYRH